MTDFFHAALQYTFMQYALLTGLLASVACGIVGTYVVARRISYIAGGIAHSVLGGLGIAYYFHQVYHLSWLQPMYGAIAAALVAAWIIGYVSLKAKEREDTVIGAVWAIGMAIGVIFISITPGYNQDLMSYLFGNILMTGTGDLWLLAALDALVLVMGVLFYNQITAVCFDEEFARVRGVNVEFYYILLLTLTALTVVILTNVVGIILLIALLTLPAATAGQFTQSLGKNMILATVLTIVIMTIGLAVSFGPNLPAGATMIIVAGIVYLAALVIARARRRMAA